MLLHLLLFQNHEVIIHTFTSNKSSVTRESQTGICFVLVCLFLNFEPYLLGNRRFHIKIRILVSLEIFLKDHTERQKSAGARWVTAIPSNKGLLLQFFMVSIIHIIYTFFLIPHPHIGLMLYVWPLLLVFHFSFLATALDYELDLIPNYIPGTLLIAWHVF